MRRKVLILISALRLQTFWPHRLVDLCDKVAHPLTLVPGHKGRAARDYCIEQRLLVAVHYNLTQQRITFYTNIIFLSLLF